MRPWGVPVACLIMASAVLAGCTARSAPSSIAVGQGPVWEPGFWWDYGVTQELRYETADGFEHEGQTPEAPVRLTVLRPESLDGQAGHLVLVSNGSLPMPWHSDVSDLAFARTTDLAMASFWYPFEHHCVSGGCGYALDLEGEVEVADQLPEQLRFPLQGGREWSLWQNASLDHGPQTHAKVLGPVQVRTPAGTYDAVRIRYTISQADLDAYVALLQEELAEDDPGAQVAYTGGATAELDYAPSARNFVAGHGEVDFDASVSGLEDEWGEDGNFSFESTWSYELEAVLLKEEGAWTDEQVLLAMGLDPLSLVTESAPSTGSPPGAGQGSGDPLQVRLVATPPGPYRAEQATEVAVRAEAISGAATGHSWSWSGALGYGYSYDDELRFTVDHPGLHVVSLTAYGHGSTSARLVLVASLHSTQSGTCPPALLVAPAVCDDILVPMSATVASLTVNATFTTPHGLPVPGVALVLVDDDGVEITRRNLAEGKASIVLTEPAESGYVWDPFAWRAYVEPPAGVGGSVSYDVRAQPMDPATALD